MIKFSNNKFSNFERMVLKDIVGSSFNPDDPAVRMISESSESKVSLTNTQLSTIWVYACDFWRTRLDLDKGEMEKT